MSQDVKSEDILGEVISKKGLLLWTVLILGVVLAIVSAKYLIGRPVITLISVEKPVVQKDLTKVVRVIDGDTIEVLIDGNKEVVRLIGIDSPESVDSRKPTQCFARESSVKLEELLEDEMVELVADETQGDKDSYGRLLRYVLLSGVSVNELMIAEGFAREYTFRAPYRYQDVFRKAQKMAKENKDGLWSICR